MKKYKKQIPIVFSSCAFLYSAFLVVFIVGLVALTIMGSKNANAATTSTINFQARLLTSSGSVVPDGNYHIEFKLYNASTSTGTPNQGACTMTPGTTADGACLWTETRSTGNLVRVVNGYLTVNLGSVNPFTTNINWDQQLWLSMRVGGSGGSASWETTEMTPRLQLTGVPYAFRAGSLVGGSGSNVTILDTGTPSGTNTIHLPAESGTLCIQASTNCGFLSSTTGVLLQSASPGTPQTGNINVSGTGIFGTKVLTPTLDTATGVTLNIGTSGSPTTTGIALNQSTTVASGKTFSVAGGLTTLTSNSTTGEALNVSNSTSSGNIAVFKNNATAVVTIGSTGNMLLQPTADSTSAFQVNRYNGGSPYALLTVNTTDARVQVPDDTPITFDSSTGQYKAQIKYTNVSSANALQIGNYNTGGNVAIQADQFMVQDTTGFNTNLSLNNTGVATFKNRVNSASAFRVQNQSGLTYFNVDTTNGKIGTPDQTTTASTPVKLQSGDVTGGSGLATGDVTLKSGQGTGTNTSTGIVTIDSGQASGSGTSGAINIGSGNSPTINVGRTGVATVNIQGGNGINIGSGGVANTIQIGNTSGSASQTINIGNNTTASSSSTVVVGSLIGASPVTLQAGTSGVLVKPASSANAFRVQTAGGNDVLHVDTASSRIGINNTSPSFTVEITRPDTTTAQGILLSATSGNDWKIYQDVGTSDLSFWNDNTNTKTVNFGTDGNVGIGTNGAGTSPLDVRKVFTVPASTDVQTINSSADTSTAFGTGGLYGALLQGSVSSTGTYNLVVGVKGSVLNNSTGTITTATGVSALVKNGNSGTITTADAVSALLAAGSGTITNGVAFHVQTPTVSTGSIQHAYGLYVENQSAGVLDNYAIYTNTGAVRIGDNLVLAGVNKLTTEGGNLNITPVTGNTIIKGYQSTNASAALNVINNGSTSIIYARNDGNVGVGTTTPSYRLDVQGGDINTSGVYRVGTTGGSSVTCSGGQVISNQVVTGGITTGGTCASAAVGSFVTLQGSTPGTADTGNFNISGTGILGTALQAPLLQTADSSANSAVTPDIALRSGSTSGTVSVTGGVTIQSGTASGASSTSGTLVLQSGNASAGSGNVTLASGTITTSANSGSLSLATGATPNGTTGAITIKSGNSTVGSSGSISIDVGTASSTKGSINIGGTNPTTAINVGATGATANATTLNLATSSGAIQTVAIGSTNGTSSTTIQGGVNGSNAVISLQTAASGVISVGGNVANTINVGATGAAANISTLNLATSSGAAQTVNIGSTNGASTTTISGGVNGTTPTLSLQVAAAGYLAIGTSAVAKNIQIGAVGSTATTTGIDIGTGAAAQTIKIGSLTSTSSTTIQSGTNALAFATGNGNITMTAGTGLITLGNTGLTGLGFNIVAPTYTSATRGVTIGTSDANITLLDLDVSTAQGSETAGNCSTSINPGGIYYSGATAANNTTTQELRGCINGVWETIVSSDQLGLMLLGVVEDSGASGQQGDLGGVTGVANGPCKVSRASATTVSVAPCVAYSQGRKVVVTTATTVTTAGTAGSTTYQHICLNGTNNSPTATAANTSQTAAVPAFSATAPILCIATVKLGTTPSITNIYDTRTFVSSKKQFTTFTSGSQTGVSAGMIVTLNGTTANQITTTTTPSAANVRGVVLVGSPSNSTTTVNAIITTSGAAFVAGTGTVTVGNTAQTSNVLGYATTAAAAAAYKDLGLVIWPGVTSGCSASTDCQYSMLVDVQPH